MPYLNLDLNYFSHVKIKRLVGILGRGAEVLPIKLWCHCGVYHAESGKLTGYAANEVEAIVEWWGKEGECVDAMLKIGIIEKIKNGYQIHDWKDHCGHLEAFKKRSKRANTIRWQRYRDSYKDSYKDATRTPKSGIKDSSIPTIPTKPKKHSHGEYHKVLLTDKEKNKLINEWGAVEFNRMVKVLDEGIALKGYKYKSHYLALRKWRTDSVPDKQAAKKEEKPCYFQPYETPEWMKGK